MIKNSQKNDDKEKAEKVISAKHWKMKTLIKNQH